MGAGWPDRPDIPLRTLSRQAGGVTLICVSHDAPVNTAREEHDPPARGKYWWVRWAVLGVALIVLVVEATLVWDQLAKAWKSLISANGWIIFAGTVPGAGCRYLFIQSSRT